MATRKNGKPGSIFLDNSKNKWHGRVYDGFHDNGSYKCKNFYGKSKAEVERKIDAYEKNKEKRKGLVDSDDTLDDRMYQVNKLEYHSNCISASSYQRREYTRKAFFTSTV